VVGGVDGASAGVNGAGVVEVEGGVLPLPSSSSSLSSSSSSLACLFVDFESSVAVEVLVLCGEVLLELVSMLGVDGVAVGLFAGVLVLGSVSLVGLLVLVSVLGVDGVVVLGGVDVIEGDEDELLVFEAASSA